ncbi:DNA polymerase I [Erysipelotrichaceae bacterium]|nr:DNA polymerase I [Erysipelotrichaceae bacterium]
MKRIVIIDGYSLFFRAYFATAYTGQFMHTSEGLPTNAIFSFSNMMFRILGEHNFTHILVALDPGGKTFRHEMLPEYKGTRSETPAEMIPQFDLLPKLLDALKIPYYKKKGFEADDIIGTLAKRAESAGYYVDILSSDRDLLQLIDVKTTVRLLKKGLSEIEDMTLEKLAEQLQLVPHQIPDLKGLMGDASDNIPGIPGIGEKTALKLLAAYGTIDGLYENVENLKGKQKEKVETYEKQARLSKALATIDCDVDVEEELEDFEYGTIDLEASQQFFRMIESKTLAKKAQSVYDLQQATILNEDESLMADLLAEVETHMLMLGENEQIILPNKAVLYFEHPYENYHTYKTPLYVYIYTPETAMIATWDVFTKNQSVLTWLADEKMEKIVFDSKKAYAFSAYNQIKIQGIIFDLQLAGYVLNPGDKFDEVADMAQTHGYSLRFQEHVYGKNTKFSVEDSDAVMKYTKEQAEMVYLLAEKIQENLEEDGLTSLLVDVEMPLARILAEMEKTGVTVDANVLKEQGVVIQKRIAILAEMIYEYAGQEFNISSPKQLGEILFDVLHLPVIKKTKTGYSTAAGVLEELMDQHEIIPLIGEYRQLSKLNSTYIKGLVPMISSDGKIHTIYKQVQTQTGRLSSIEPNLQNIPIRLEEGRLIRKAFLPSSAENVLIAADYSQIELRVLAELADVQELKDAFIHKRDIHTETAVKIFDVASAAEVTSIMRSHAKAVNFGIIYGMSDFGLATQLKISRKEAKFFIDKYFELFPGIKAYMAEMIDFAEKEGFVETILKRRRYFPTIHSRNFNERNFAKRAAMNAPIQGSAADILKLAMLAIDEMIEREKLTAKMILQVHDELIFDVPLVEKEIMQTIIEKGMTKAYEMSVPLDIEMSVAHTWYEAK